MSPWIARIKALVPHTPSQQERAQEYLNDAVDGYDIERRQWELDHRLAPQRMQAGALGGALH